MKQDYDKELLRKLNIVVKSGDIDLCEWDYRILKYLADKYAAGNWNNGIETLSDTLDKINISLNVDLNIDFMSDEEINEIAEFTKYDVKYEELIK